MAIITKATNGILPMYEGLAWVDSVFWTYGVTSTSIGFMQSSDGGSTPRKYSATCAASSTGLTITCSGLRHNLSGIQYNWVILG